MREPPLSDQPSPSVAIVRRYPFRTCPYLETAHRIKEVENTGSLNRQLHGFSRPALESLFYQPNEHDDARGLANLHCG